MANDGPNHGPSYGQSPHYSGAQGQAYFDYQARHAATAAALNAWKFAPHIAPTDTVLDLGAGSGALLDRLPGAKKIAVEINPVARDYCRTTYQLDAVEDFATVTDASVDVVVSNHALEHIPFPIGALREVWRVLKPNGQLILCVPIDDWRMQQRYRPEDINRHLHTWTPLLLGHTLAEAGFAVERLRISAYAWPPKYALLFRRLPRPLFDGLCVMWGWLRRRRQIIARARKPQLPTAAPATQPE